MDNTWNFATNYKCLPARIHFGRGASEGRIVIGSSQAAGLSTWEMTARSMACSRLEGLDLEDVIETIP
jgi:hypothetical protein